MVTEEIVCLRMRGLRIDTLTLLLIFLPSREY
jgi:hypothetical protein